MKGFPLQTRVGSAGGDPSPGGLGCIEEAMPAHPPQLGLKVEVRDATVDGNEEFWNVESPVVAQKLEDRLWRSVESQPHVL